MSSNYNLLNSINTISNGNPYHYAKNHYVPTKAEPWTDEELRNAGQKLVNLKPEEKMGEYLVEYMDWNYELIRRATEDSKNSNQFSYIIRDFSPHVIIEGGARVNGYDSSIFQKLADTFENQRLAYLELENGYGSRFLSPDEIDIRLRVLHAQFDEAIRSLADIFKDFADELGLNIKEVESSVLKIGELIKNHIWSGKPAESINEMLNNSKTDMSLNQLNDIGSVYYKQFRPNWGK